MFDIRKIQEQVTFQAIKKASDEETAVQIIMGDDNSGTPETNPEWVKNCMARLESRFDPGTILEIRRNCQCGYGMDEKLDLLKELMEHSSNLEEFASQEKARAAGLSYSDGDLYLQFPYCPCPMLAEVDRLDSLTWCQCTTGYSKVLFEKAFDCPVAVELLKSVKAGDEICLMKIVPQRPVWN